ncbi:unnamed protein product, partial [Ectocarpus fasciculatus]
NCDGDTTDEIFFWLVFWGWKAIRVYSVSMPKKGVVLTFGVLRRGEFCQPSQGDGLVAIKIKADSFLFADFLIKILPSHLYDMVMCSPSLLAVGKEIRRHFKKVGECLPTCCQGISCSSTKMSGNIAPTRVVPSHH